MITAIDRDIQDAIQEDAVFAPLMGHRLGCACSSRLVDVDRDLDAAGAVLLEDAARHAGRGLVHPLVSHTGHDVISAAAVAGQQITRLRAQRGGNDHQRADRRPGLAALQQAEHRGAQSRLLGKALQRQPLLAPQLADIPPNRGQNVRCLFGAGAHVRDLVHSALRCGRHPRPPPEFSHTETSRSSARCRRKNIRAMRQTAHILPLE